MNNQTHKRIITELSAVENKLDEVLFDTGDMAAGATATAGVGTAGLGLLYARGRRGMQKKKTWKPQDISNTIGRGASQVPGDTSQIWKKLMTWAKKVPGKVR